MTTFSGKYLGNLRASCVHDDSGTEIITEPAAGNGGTGGSYAATDLVATGLACCAMTIMGRQAATLGLDITGTTFKVSKEMDQAARRIGSISVTFIFPEGRYDKKARTQFERAAHACPVHGSLSDNVNITFNFVWPDGE